MISQPDFVDDVDIDRKFQNSFDDAKDMLHNEVEDNITSRPALNVNQMENHKETELKHENITGAVIDDDYDAEGDALFVSQTPQAEQGPDVEEINEGIYEQIRAKFGTLNKSAFKRKMKSTLDVKALKDTRQALFDLAKRKRYDCPDGRLVERLPRSNSAPVADKLSEDIYTIYHFIEGEDNYSDMKACISKWALKRKNEPQSS